MTFETQIDGKRLTKAHADYDALVKAERDAEAALAQAKDAAKQAHAVAQAAADRGDAVAKLEAAEIAVETADRAARVAGRVLEAARKRREAGVETLAHETKQAHGAAFTAGMKRFIAIREDALDVFARLEQLKAEHGAVR